MRGNLKHAVGGSVDDRRTRPHMFGAEFLNDFGPGGGFVAEGGAPGLFFELVHDGGRKTVGKQWKRLRQMDSGHLPVARGSVFTR